MYKSFGIKGFKLVKEFRIQGFQRVNLLTGRNNVGKTALLEALFIHSGASNISLPFSIESFRGITQFQGGMDAVSSGLFSGFNATQTIEFEGIDKLDIRRTCTLKIVPAPIIIQQSTSEEDSGSRGQALEVLKVRSWCE